MELHAVASRDARLAIEPGNLASEHHAAHAAMEGHALSEVCSVNSAHPLLVEIDLDLSVGLLSQLEDVEGVGVESLHNIAHFKLAVAHGSQQQRKAQLQSRANLISRPGTEAVNDREVVPQGLHILHISNALGQSALSGGNVLLLEEEHNGVDIAGDLDTLGLGLADQLDLVLARHLGDVHGAVVGACEEQEGREVRVVGLDHHALVRGPRLEVGHQGAEVAEDRAVDLTARSGGHVHTSEAALDVGEDACIGSSCADVETIISTHRAGSCGLHLLKRAVVHNGVAASGDQVHCSDTASQSLGSADLHIVLSLQWSLDAHVNKTGQNDSAVAALAVVRLHSLADNVGVAVHSLDDQLRAFDVGDQRNLEVNGHTAGDVTTGHVRGRAAVAVLRGQADEDIDEMAAQV
eukprot:Colp12_sorted_trinity150504_noHs@4937